MDYTLSNSYDTHAGTGNRMHEDSKAVPTAVSDLDMNSVIWSLMEIVKAAGLTGIQFDKAVPASYGRLLAAVQAIITQRFTGANQLLGVNTGYQKLPGGLILQWGLGGLASGAGTGTFSLPIAFPTAFLRGVISDVGSTVYTYAIAGASASTYTVWRTNTAGASAYQYLALGY